MLLNFYAKATLCIILFNILISGISLKGQFAYSGIKGNDALKGEPSFESSVLYIPTISLLQPLKNNNAFDIEVAYKSFIAFSENEIIDSSEELYRGWLRYTNQKLELRVGLQKIIFGPSQILRPLTWFDTFDLRDPSEQTEGVDAFRLNWVPIQKISLTSWLIDDGTDIPKYGARLEMDYKSGQWGLSIHDFRITEDPTTTLFGLDYRYDGMVGLWTENSFKVFDFEESITSSMVGLDYTVPVFSGITLMLEYMQIKNDLISDKQIAIMSRMPLGMTHSLMLISSTDLLNNNRFNYVRLSALYDYFSINYMISINPKRDEYFIPEILPSSLIGFGTNFQVSIIYNH